MAEENSTPEVAQPEPISLTLQDLNVTANIIDLAVQRGAFKGAEVATVGNAFNKLVDVIQKISPPPAEPAPEASAETPAETTEETATKE
tara:strand:- start:744 stop:1010 length:267 start_codon:yes stop_codon:yes gene_type:complete